METELKASALRRYEVILTPVRIEIPRVGLNRTKQTFVFPIKKDRVYHDVRFLLKKGFRPSHDEDPRLRKVWLFESNQRRFASELQPFLTPHNLDQFLFKCPLGNFYDVEHRVGDLIDIAQLPSNTLYCTERQHGGFGRLMITKG